jgi:hypothetical protein
MTNSYIAECAFPENKMIFKNDLENQLKVAWNARNDIAV